VARHRGAAKAQTGAFLIYQEGSLVIRAIRDYFQPTSARS
jgi:ribonuclease E